MTQRFQIEDLILQDASGVVFRALDTETGKTVAVRRFFPFGSGGGGLDPDEQTAYHIAINRLAGLSHPALRSIISGGCDPVDGIPFIATEWINGDSLQSHLEQGAIPAEAVTALITQALEVCELLSHLLAEQAVWVETDVRTIIFSSPESGRGFTFWISPLKWLGGGNESKGLESIVTLTEEVMDWKGRIISDQAGGGLGGWLKWLRNTAATTSLQEAREALAASVGAEPPPPAKTLAATAAGPTALHPPSNKRLVPALVLTLITAIIASGWFVLQNTAAQNPVIATPPARISPIKDADRRAAEFSAQAALADQEAAAILAAQKAATESRGGVISWDDHELLVEMKSKSVIVEGIIWKIDKLNNRKTIYLLFSDVKNQHAARVGMTIGDANAAPIIESFKPFVGKKVRVSGTVKLQKRDGLKCPDIMINDISTVRIVE